MAQLQRIVVFLLDEQRYGLDSLVIERVVAAVEITPLPKAPSIVLGVFALHGRIIPVVNTRRRFALPERELSASDQFIIARAGNRTVALWVDGTSEVLALAPADLVTARTVLPELPYVHGVARLSDGLVVVHDLATFLELDEATALDAALRETETRPVHR